MKQFRAFALLAFLTATAVFTSCSDDEDSGNGGNYTPDVINQKVNQKVDSYLSSNYLWNTEYKTLTRDFTAGYEDFFYNSLKSMKTNTLDYKRRTASDGAVSYTIYSYIYKDELNNSSSTSSAVASAEKLVNKKKEYSRGIAGLLPVAFTDEEGKDVFINFFVRGVYQNSMAAEQGIKRGGIITEVNGETITVENYQTIYRRLVSPTQVDEVFVSYCNFDYDNSKFGKTESIRLGSVATECNPILYHTVDTVGDHRIAYLSYKTFDAGFDEELFDVLKSFKAGGATDIVLDLRYNNGGHTISANLISSCIAADAAKDKVFMSMRYNDERMKALGNKRKEVTFAYPSYEFYENTPADITAAGLGLKKVYVLVGSGSASASELVINALRGIDIEVVLIGEQTEGKNVGMESEEYELDGVTYDIVPITFQSYNAKGYGDYEDGFAPDYEIDEVSPDDPNTIYVYRPFGSHDDPLYGKALSLITGDNAAKAKVKGQKTTRGTLPFTGRLLAEPSDFRLGKNGMIKP